MTMGTEACSYLELDEEPVSHPPLVLAPDEGTDSSLDGLRDVVHVLRLDERLQVLLEDASEVVLQEEEKRASGFGGEPATVPPLPRT